ncbi:MAG: hypothetical protein GPJ52_02750 [Candidatus Heimdallarchaeota archaeon]|nr:hypothetical protein [Candidatus Heimdallarchaeota archaeon]
MRFIRKYTCEFIFIIIGILALTTGLSGRTGFWIANRQQKNYELDFTTINSVDDIFEGFTTNIYNSTSDSILYYEYSIGYYSSNYSNIGRINHIGYNIENCFAQLLDLYPAFSIDCSFQSITFVLDSYPNVDYARLSILVYGDGEIIYSDSYIESDITIDFEPNVDEITIVIF